jgi:PleD family two-component response regulator
MDSLEADHPVAILYPTVGPVNPAGYRLMPALDFLWMSLVGCEKRPHHEDMRHGQVAADAIQPSVLVVDDDADFRTTLADALSDEGYRIIQATNGQEALGRLETERPTLLLVDLLMPTMSGLELLQKVRKTPTLRGIPVVVVTAANDAMLSV